MTTIYAPPPGPPPGHAIPLTYPLTTPEESSNLRSQGYARLSVPSSHPLCTASHAAFAASRSFFALPSSEKSKYHLSTLSTREGVDGGSEDGFSRVDGEKEMITVRRSEILCPSSLSQIATDLWNACGAYLSSVLRIMESSLALPEGSYAHTITNECILPTSGNRTESLLRMFRYDRSPEESKLVSAHHKDIGLLTVVIGSSPGLEVYNSFSNTFCPIEGSDADEGGLTFTLLTGATLTRLTNGIYKPGVHRVFVPPSSPSSTEDESKYRYSLVYALRPTPLPSSILHISSLTSNITGPFHPALVAQLDNVTSAALFKRIQKEFWSVNVGGEEREKQRKRLEEFKKKQKEQQQQRMM